MNESICSGQVVICCVKVSDKTEICSMAVAWKRMNGSQVIIRCCKVAEIPGKALQASSKPHIHCMENLKSEATLNSVCGLLSRHDWQKKNEY